MSTETKKERIERAGHLYHALVSDAPGFARTPFVETLAESEAGISEKYAKQIYASMDLDLGGVEEARFRRIEQALDRSGRPARRAHPFDEGSPSEAGVSTYVVVADAHFGQERESRVARVEDAVYALLDDVDDATVVLLGDTMHADTHEGTTTKGTSVDPGRRPEDVVPEVIDFVQGLDERGWPICVVQGNHDMFASIFVAASVRRTAKRAHVLASGRLALIHGDIPTKKVYGHLRELGLVSNPTEALILRGHNHVLGVEFVDGVGYVITLPAATPRSEWAKSEGYPWHSPAVTRIDLDAHGRLVGIRFQYIAGDSRT
jgi:metallophosphoesterase superfamily enzyme